MPKKQTAEKLTPKQFAEKWSEKHGRTVSIGSVKRWCSNGIIPASLCKLENNSASGTGTVWKIDPAALEIEAPKLGHPFQNKKKKL